MCPRSLFNLPFYFSLTMADFGDQEKKDPYDLNPFSGSTEFGNIFGNFCSSISGQRFSCTLGTSSVIFLPSMQNSLCLLTETEALGFRRGGRKCRNDVTKRRSHARPPRAAPPVLIACRAPAKNCSQNRRRKNAYYINAKKIRQTAAGFFLGVSFSLCSVVK